jgi:NAD+--asparagine ADP-ribosyltransferase
MLTRPARILPSERDIRDSAQCAAWTNQMKSEMAELIGRTKATIARSRALMKELDRLLAGGSERL